MDNNIENKVFRTEDNYNEVSSSIEYFKNDTEDEQLLEMFNLYTSNSKYEDDVWIMDKRYTDRNQDKNEVSIYFNNEYKGSNNYNTIKRYALLLIIHNYSISSIRMKVYYMLKFIESFSNQKILISLNEKDIDIYYQTLLNSKNGIATKEVYWREVVNFFKGMHYNMQYETLNKYIPFRRDRKNNSKMHMPEDLAIRYDKIFDGSKIPLHYRVIYWILRCIPNRISEVLSIRIDCLKPYKNGEYSLSIPTFKQSGQHALGENRLIIIKYVDMGKYLIDLIKEQIHISLSLQDQVYDKGYLFTNNYYTYYEKKGVYKKDTRVIVTKKGSVTKIFNKISVREKIEYNLTSHLFRHIGITDRIESGIFRLIDIAGITGHKTETMISNNYVHVNQKRLREKQLMISDGSNNAIYFRGKIISDDNNKRWDKILENPYAHTLGGLGICADISNCNKSTFECLNCNFFIPNADDLSYFEDQVLQWEEKLKNAFSNNYLRENASCNIELNQNIVNKIKGLLRGEDN